MQLIDGKQTAATIKAEIKAEVEQLDMSENGAIKQELAALKLRVDEIELKVQSLEENDDVITSEMASLKISNNNITATVEQVETNLNANIDSVNSSIDTITQKLTTTVSTENISILVLISFNLKSFLSLFVFCKKQKHYFVSVLSFFIDLCT